MAVAHKLNRHYIGIELGSQMSELVVRRMNKVIEGESSGISKVVGWQGGGDFAFFNFDKNNTRINDNQIVQTLPYSEPKVKSKKGTAHYKQLDFFEVFQQYPDYIVENDVASEENIRYNSNDELVRSNKSVLICYVKADNMRKYINRSAKIYYTGKRFPSTVELNKLFYFMPYIKGKGVRDLYMIKKARVGTRKEGQPDNNPNDLRLVFEIEFVKQLFDEYMPIRLEIWRTYTDTTLSHLFSTIG